MRSGRRARRPALWGTGQHLAGLFAGAGQLPAVRKADHFRFASPAHFLQVLRDYYGPTLKAFGALDAAGREALAAELSALLERCNTAGAASQVVPSEYLEVIIAKRSAWSIQRSCRFDRGKFSEDTLGVSSINLRYGAPP